MASTLVAFFNERAYAYINWLQRQHVSMSDLITVPLDDLRFTGTGLVRPECVVTHASGLLFAADWSGSGGVAVVAPDGSVRKILARRPADNPLRPNGIAFEPGGTFLVAHLGMETGGLYRLHPDGALEEVLTTLDGAPLPPCNFPLIDRQGRIWLTVSTRVVPRADDYRAEASTGFIVLIDARGARIVADGLGYANECVLSADERTLFVNETFARRLTRFRVADDGTLGERAVVARFGAGVFPDGLARDEHDGLWITSIVSNRVIRVTPDGRQGVVLEDCDPAHVDWVEVAYRADALGRPHLDGTPARVLRNLSSLAFGGPDRRRAFLGTLLGDTIPSFDVPVRGVPNLHFAGALPAALRTKAPA
jgi:sugar lactone lactonase YvrE